MWWSSLVEWSGAGMLQGWECFPPTNLVWARILDLASNLLSRYSLPSQRVTRFGYKVNPTSCGLLLVLVFFSPSSLVSHSPKNHWTLLNFTSIWIQWTNSHLMDVPLLTLFYYYFIFYQSINQLGDIVLLTNIKESYNNYL